MPVDGQAACTTLPDQDGQVACTTLPDQDGQVACTTLPDQLVQAKTGWACHPKVGRSIPYSLHICCKDPCPYLHAPCARCPVEWLQGHIQRRRGSHNSWFRNLELCCQCSPSLLLLHCFCMSVSSCEGRVLLCRWFPLNPVPRCSIA